MLTFLRTWPLRVWPKFQFRLLVGGNKLFINHPFFPQMKGRNCLPFCFICSNSWFIKSCLNIYRENIFKYTTFHVKLWIFKAWYSPHNLTCFLLLSNAFWVEIRIFIHSMNNQKISIRFFNDREVRAVWDDSTAIWWFSVLDIVAVLTDQDDYSKLGIIGNTLKLNWRKKNMSWLVLLPNWSFKQQMEKNINPICWIVTG